VASFAAQVVAKICWEWPFWASCQLRLGLDNSM
jgi:hypothetical protein